ncbi:MAG TPA: response regulator [Solirubrobacterales bacterium]|nr:response regulator [Solirubrobacterales bacterium]
MAELILIVEDNAKNMKLVRDVLEQSGFRTLESGTAEEALELVMSNRPDLILMDIELPEMDGFEAVGRLKGDPDTATIPVCAVTAFAMNDDRERCLRAGFDGYLSKPINVAEFPSQVRELLGRAREGAQ